MKTPPPDDDPMLSVLLTEVFTGQTPPDLSDQILSRLDERTLPAASGGHARRWRSSSAQAQRPVRRRILWPVGTAAALLTLAASSAWLIMNLRPAELAPPGQQPSIATAPRDPAAPPRDAIAQRPAAAPVGDASSAMPPDGAPAGQQQPPAGGDEGLVQLPDDPTTMELAEVPFGDRPADAPQPAPQPLLAPAPRPPRHNANSIVHQIDGQLQQAWQSLGVQPTAAADAAVVADRLERVIGVRLAADQASDVDAIRRALQSEPAQRHTASLLARQLLGPAAWSRLKNDARDAVVTAFSSAVAGQRGVDDVIGGLLAPQANRADQAASQAWLAAIGGKSPASLAEQVGQAVLDLDLRCGRCHDHPVDGSVRQADYWALAAALQRNGDATAQRRDAGSLFYELPDGRQRAASAAVPLNWLGADDSRQVEADRRQIANSLIDNPRLAEGIVNRLWEITYGHPLVGVASDPDAPPRDEHLALLRQRLAAQLRAHDFDLGEAIAWIAAAAPLRLQSPQVFEPSERVLASDQAIAAARWQVHAFAAFDAKPEGSESLSSLLAMATRFQGGATLDDDALRSTLAQPSSQGGSDRTNRTRPTAKQRREALLRSSFPSPHAATAPGLPAAWLDGVEGFDEQVRHLYYAAGYGTPTARQIQSATALRSGAGSDSLALNQLWWAMQHSATP